MYAVEALQDQDSHPTRIDYLNQVWTKIEIKSRKGGHPDSLELSRVEGVVGDMKIITQRIHPLLKVTLAPAKGTPGDELFAL